MSPWVVPGYAEERQLGRGASGRVVAAVDQSTGQRVAIKYLSPRLFRDPEFLAGFRGEADLLRSLDAPQVVRLFDYVEAPGEGAAIVMELVDGVSLHEMISRRGATSPEAALVVLKGSLLGLAAAHALGIVHRDYKPENVLVDAEGQSKLSDFGVAVKEGRHAPSAGTPLYMAPEQWEGMAPSPATDIYAAAAVFFECLTGKTPFSRGLGQLRQQHIAAAVPVEMVDEPLRGLIARGMAKNPSARPANAMDFVTELESTAAAAYGGDWESRGRSQLKERAAALLLLLLGTAAVGGAGVAAASTWLANHKTAAIAATAALTVAVVGIAVAAVALSGGGSSHSTVTFKQQASGSSPGGAGTPTGAPTGTSSGPGVKTTFDAMVTAMPPVVTSSCTTATTFTYSADLSSTGAGTVTYKWVYSTGKSGPVQKATFLAAGTRQVSGGTVSVKTASTGWAAIQILNVGGVLSNKAIYKLVCSVPPAGTIGLSAYVTPAAQTVACGSPTPSFTFTGLISDSKAETVTYHWALSNGTTSPPKTLTFSSAGTQAVQPLTVTPSADTASGTGILVVTSPGTETSSPAFYTLTCTKGNSPPPPLGKGNIAVSLSSSPSSPDTVTCGSTPPTFTLTGTLTSDQAMSGVKYQWVRSNGTTGGSGTISLAAGTPVNVTDKFTPPSDAFSGSDTLNLTSLGESQTLPIALSCAYPPVSISGSLPSGTAGTPYTGASFSATGGEPPYTWSASGLPAGLGMSTSGTISGTPTESGTFMVVVTVKDSETQAPMTTSMQFTLVINPAPSTVPGG